MNPEKLYKLLKKTSKDVEVKKDDPTSFRIFIYNPNHVLLIAFIVSKIKTLLIKKISDYDNPLEGYPCRVIRVETLRIMKKYKKRKIKAKNQR